MSDRHVLKRWASGFEDIVVFVYDGTAKLKIRNAGGTESVRMSLAPDAVETLRTLLNARHSTERSGAAACHCGGARMCNECIAAKCHHRNKHAAAFDATSPTPDGKETVKP